MLSRLQFSKKKGNILFRRFEVQVVTTGKMFALYHFLAENEMEVGKTNLIKNFDKGECREGDKVFVKWGSGKRMFLAKIIRFGGRYSHPIYLGT